MSFMSSCDCCARPTNLSPNVCAWGNNPDIDEKFHDHMACPSQRRKKNPRSPWCSKHIASIDNRLDPLEKDLRSRNVESVRDQERACLKNKRVEEQVAFAKENVKRQRQIEELLSNTMTSADTILGALNASSLKPSYRPFQSTPTPTPSVGVLALPAPAPVLALPAPAPAHALPAPVPAPVPVLARPAPVPVRDLISFDDVPQIPIRSLRPESVPFTFSSRSSLNEPRISEVLSRSNSTSSSSGSDEEVSLMTKTFKGAAVIQ